MRGRLWIVVVAVAAALVVVFRPAGADEPVGCEDVGGAAEVRDPRGDAAGPAGIDLTAAWLAGSPETVCAEFTAAGAIPAATSFSVVLDERLVVSATVLYGGTRQISIQYPGAEERDDAGLIDGDVEVSGDRLTLRVERSLLPPVDADAAWQARSLALGDRPEIRHTDCAPRCR